MNGGTSPNHTKNKHQMQVCVDLDMKDVEKVDEVTTAVKTAQVVTLPEYPKHGVIG